MIVPNEGEESLATDSGATAPLGVGEGIDALSLSQAIKDFEIANGRVVDLTQRLITLHTALAKLRDEVAVIQGELAASKSEVVAITLDRAAIIGSKAYRLVGKIRSVRRMFR